MDIDAPRDIGERESVAGEPFVLLEPRLEFRQHASDPFGRPLDPFLRKPLVGDVLPKKCDEVVVLDDGRCALQLRPYLLDPRAPEQQVVAQRLQMNLRVIPKPEPPVHQLEIGRSAGSQRSFWKGPIEVINDITGFDYHDAVMNQRRYLRLRIYCDVLRR